MNMRKLLLLIILILNALLVCAQKDELDSLTIKRRQANLEYPILYKENIELSTISPLGEIGAPSRYVINGKLITSYMILVSKVLPIVLSINPNFTVRVRNERSAGVRTPSYRLGGSMYLRLSTNSLHYKYAELSYTHHSNGADADALLPNKEINTYDGNFSINDLTMSYRFGHYTGSFAQRNYYGFHFKTGLQWHKWFRYETALIGNYGFTRINSDFSFRVYQRLEEKMKKVKWRLDGHVSYAINPLTNYKFIAPKKRLNAEFSANYGLPFMQSSFLMVSFGYYGEDPYNIYFNDKYAFARFGVSGAF